MAGPTRARSSAHPAGPSLFDPPGLGDAPDANAPLAVRMRPRELAELVGQDDLVAPGSPLRRLVEGVGTPTSVILWGPPGTGKTTIAALISQAADRSFVELSAVTAGVKDVRAAIDGARMASRPTVLFIDEVHRFTRTQQDALLPGVENGWVTLVAATTENPSFAITSPLLSRSLLLTLRPLGQEEIGQLLDRAVSSPRGLDGRVALDEDARADLVRYAGGDARRALTYLEAATEAALGEATSRATLPISAGASGGDPSILPEAARRTDGAAPEGSAAHSPPVRNAGAPDHPHQRLRITAAHVAAAVQRALVRYDRTGDQHYDVISAFIKSVRGSDVDAALHYLARMIEAGEDPRFIARRLVILASEDVGMADPNALGVAAAAMTAAAQIGLPEARLPLAQATIHLALAPKSNAVIKAIDAAAADIRAGRVGHVPIHLRYAHYPGARSHGVAGYVYPHNNPAGVVAQQYAPDPVLGRRYYEPTDHGAEERITDIADRLRAVLNSGADPAEPESVDADPGAGEA